MWISDKQVRDAKILIGLAIAVIAVLGWGLIETIIWMFS